MRDFKLAQNERNGFGYCDYHEEVMEEENYLRKENTIMRLEANVYTLSLFAEALSWRF
jgi:hypothetical protein